ncbi:TadE/TadG family type IV pilus assembly protein [Nitrospira sp. BLG_1]|uniref:TadE/TadG family type IV pilus assembly protein n=1 Tax=Nitrospira sp. BLG_1 TaxID=3395883 RepID=UPI0039BD7F68
MQKLNERGAAAVEFALLLPVFLMILFGIIEFGMIMYGREVVTNAAREGARAGIVQGPPKRTSGEITTIANSYLTGTGVNQADVTFTPTGAGLASPNLLTVTAVYTYNFLIPYIPNVVPGVPNPLVITTQVVMRHE